MRARTPKRSKEEEEYARACDEIDAEAEETKQMGCFFCGEDVANPCAHHHLRGRTGRLLTDKRYIVRAHWDHHQEYHDLPVRKQKWREVFMENLREKDPQTYYKEREKENK